MRLYYKVMLNERRIKIEEMKILTLSNCKNWFQKILEGLCLNKNKLAYPLCDPSWAKCLLKIKNAFKCLHEINQKFLKQSRFI